ncbi:hypothetical protein Strop_2305 [Salinispora tropica CNB-440]|uniref:Transposase IS116/IS110/IS902 family protein n=1 Tax=Salinispora tropica (strain ATCC BAA-916 / DSM 44818 / JCM 13857 / NBRC 105044 / CNB-440) TaxID=369723 RepID=A4X7A5_SALTO|nr:hypothetical protein Strop_2305 [Salinispora tropica CNB-440]
MSLPQLVVAAARFRPGQIAGIEAASKLALKSLATRYQQLTTEITTLDGEIERLAHQAAPQLMAIKGRRGRRRRRAAGRDRRQPRTAAQRVRVRASLRRRADPRLVRQDQPAPAQPRRQPPPLHPGLERARYDERTRAYAARRTTEGKTKREIIRCLKRYLAREVFTALRVST